MLAVSGTVLVVDDDAAVRAALKFALEVEGFHVQLYDGPQALLADHNLPERAAWSSTIACPRSTASSWSTELRSRNVCLPAILISGRVSKHLRIWRSARA